MQKLIDHCLSELEGAGREGTDARFLCGELLRELRDTAIACGLPAVVKRCDIVNTSGEWSEVEPIEFRLCLSAIGKLLVPKEYLDVKSFAKRVKASPETVTKLCKSGAIKCRNDGTKGRNAFKIPATEIEVFKRPKPVVKAEVRRRKSQPEDRY